MCIALLTTAHPDYALIALDNRDEFILRPTSRPHWWTAPVCPPPASSQADLSSFAPAATQEILSSRDLLRAERGTWLGLTPTGHFAVLTNYRETSDASALYHGARSRGAIVTAWLTAPSSETTSEFVARSLGHGGADVRGIGGFSLICGKLRRRVGEGPDGGRVLEPLAVLSNRTDHPERVPWICGSRGEVIGLSNTSFDDPAVWPKVQDGKAALRQTVEAAVTDGYSQAKLTEELFKVLDIDALPNNDQLSFEEASAQLRNSIFIHAIGDAEHQAAMAEAVANGQGKPAFFDDDMRPPRHGDHADNSPAGFMTGMYGTQRQTVVLVDWDGKVTYVERALWDAHGNPVERGKGDVRQSYMVESWEA